MLARARSRPPPAISRPAVQCGCAQRAGCSSPVVVVSGSSHSVCANRQPASVWQHTVDFCTQKAAMRCGSTEATRECLSRSSKYTGNCTRRSELAGGGRRGSAASTQAPTLNQGRAAIAPSDALAAWATASLGCRSRAARDTIDLCGSYVASASWLGSPRKQTSPRFRSRWLLVSQMSW
jgi:hypothetical protein